MLACLVLVAVAASALPYVHEAMRSAAGGMTMAGMRAMPVMGSRTGAVTPYAVAQAAMAAKVALAALGVAGFVFWLIGRERTAPGTGRLSIFTTAPLIGAALAIGLAAFDCCTRFHGGGADASGGCHCWLTGVLGVAGALAAGAVMLCGRVLAAWATAIIRVIVALVVRLAPRALDAAARAFRIRPTARRPTPLVARRIAGRAPPFTA